MKTEDSETEDTRLEAAWNSLFQTLDPSSLGTRHFPLGTFHFVHAPHPPIRNLGNGSPVGRHFASALRAGSEWENGKYSDRLRC